MATACKQSGPERGTNQGHQPTQNPHRPHCRRNIAGTQHGGAQILISLVVEGNKAHHGQVTRVVIVAIEERQLLCAMRGIVGRIKIDGDQPGVMV